MRRRHRAATVLRLRGTWVGAAVAAGIACLLLIASGPSDDIARKAHPLAARAAYAKAMYLIDRWSADALHDAETYLSEALRLDSTFPEARAALATVARLRGDFDSAEARARETLSLEPGNARAHLELGLVFAMRDWSWADAARQVVQAISEDPASAEAHAAHAAILTVLGRHGDALDASGRAYAADPVSALIRVDHGWFHYYAGDYDTAWRVCGEAGKLAADSAAAALCQYKAASMAGDESRTFQAAVSLVEHWRAAEAAGMPELEADPSSVDEFKRLRRMRIERLREARAAPPEAFATAYAEVGDLPAALEMLETALERHSAGLPLALRDPVFEPIRGEPRFRRLVRHAVTGGAERGTMS